VGTISGDASDLVRDSLENARSAIDELRELAHGIHPAALTRHGLAAALRGLADRAPLAVEVGVAPERYSESVESAAYFVAAEAPTTSRSTPGRRRRA
jgi:signal transduction histidine kinase